MATTDEEAMTLRILGHEDPGEFCMSAEVESALLRSTWLAERIAQAKAEALKEAAVYLWGDKSAESGTTKATYNAIYATWLEQRAAALTPAVSHSEPTEGAK